MSDVPTPEELLSGAEERLKDVAVEALLDAAWESIAAAGWNRYQLHGRGALLASIRLLEGKSLSMNYITRNPKAPLPKWLDTAIASYDPNTSVVLVLMEHDAFVRTAGREHHELVKEYLGVVEGRAYLKIATRLPPPSDCADKMAH